MRNLLLAVLCAGCLVTPAFAQEATPAEAPSTPYDAAPPPAPAAPAVEANPVQSAPAAAPAPAADDEAAALHEAQAFYDSLNRRTGVIALLNGKVQLNIPETHYYLGPEDARHVIVDVWRNPPEAANNVQGMIFEAGANPAAGAWGAVLDYMQDGHVDDHDASTINYTDLLHRLQQQVQSTNAQRRTAGYPEMTLTGWAEPPHYDQARHTLYWAKSLSSSDNFSSINYDIRVLGRDSVFVVSFVAAPEQLDLIRASAPAVMAMPAFTHGNTYADYNPGVDRQAAYGLGGLIAGGALVAVAQKAGLLTLLLALGKKFIILVVAGFAGIVSFVRRMFGGGKRDSDGSSPAD